MINRNYLYFYLFCGMTVMLLNSFRSAHDNGSFTGDQNSWWLNVGSSMEFDLHGSTASDRCAELHVVAS